MPQHPADSARAILGAENREPGELTATELAWLHRLPLNTGDVSFDDAVQLASLAASVKVQHTASRRLIESIWRPLDDLHRERVARARLAAAERADVRVSEAGFGAVAASFIDEYPEASDSIESEANSHARIAAANRIIADWQRLERSRIDRELDRARRDLGDVRTRRDERAETTRDHPSPTAPS